MNDTTNDFSDDLEQAFGDYEVPERKDFDPLPDDTYDVFVDKAELTKTKTTDQNMLKMTFKIMSGKYKNRLIFKNSVLNDAQRIQYLKADLKTMKIEIKSLGELKAKCKDMLDLKLAIQQKTSEKVNSEGKPYVNHYINKCEGKIDSSSFGNTSGNTSNTGDDFTDDDFISDDDIPF